MRSKLLLLSVSVLLLGFWLRIFELQRIPPGMHFDEARYLIRAWRVAEGEGLPLWFETSPEPFDAMARGSFQKFVGLTPFASRVFSIYLNILGIAATMTAARTLYRYHAGRHLIALVAGLTLAVMPASAIMGRYIYRIHWIAPGEMLALTALLWGWYTGKARYYAVSGFFTAITAMFYLAGLTFPPLMGLIVLLHELGQAGWREWRLAGQRMAIWTGAVLLTMLPWFYLYLRIDNWLTQRVDHIRYEIDPSDPVGLLKHSWEALEPIYHSDIPFLMSPRFNTFTTPYLNPLLLALLLIGLAASLWSIIRLRAWTMSLPFLLIGAAALPGILTITPGETIRLVGMFPALALVVGLGAGTLWQSIPSKRLIWLGTTVLTIYSAFYTYSRVHDHFTTEPRLFDAPNAYDGIDAFHYIRLKEVLLYVAEAQQPIYFPVNQLDYLTAVAWLRPIYFPEMQPWAGELLPAGEVFIPADHRHDIPPIDRPTTYALMLPDQHKILLLPPPQFDSLEFEAGIQARGTHIYNSQGDILGYAQSITPADNPFTVAPRTFAANHIPIAVFDNNLELLALDTPANITPGTWVPVDFYWRLREAQNRDYFMFVQVWDATGQSIGKQNDEFSGIYRWVYPPSMWAAGGVIPERRWVQIFEGSPPGGYYFALSVQTYPIPTLVDFTNTPGTRRLNDFLLASRTIVPFEPSPAPPPDALTPDVLFDQSIRLTHVTLSTPLEALKPGENLVVNLYWYAAQPPRDNFTIFLHVRDASGEIIAQQDVQPMDGRYPTSTWNRGVDVMTTHILTLPSEASTLVIGMYHSLTFERVSAAQASGESLPDNVLSLQ